MNGLITNGSTRGGKTMQKRLTALFRGTGKERALGRFKIVR